MSTANITSSGLYIPVHKRKAASISSSSSSVSSSPSTASGSLHSTSDVMSSAHSPDTSSQIPSHTKIPLTYDIHELLALSSLAHLAPPQLERVRHVLSPNFLPSQTHASRRVRSGRKGKRATVTVALGTDVESRRKRHTTSPWVNTRGVTAQPHTMASALGESWRDARTVLVAA